MKKSIRGIRKNKKRNCIKNRVYKITYIKNTFKITNGKLIYTGSNNITEEFVIVRKTNITI